MPDANVQFVMTAKDLASGKMRELKGELTGMQKVGLGVRQSFKDGLGIGAGLEASARPPRQQDWGRRVSSPDCRRSSRPC